MKSFGIKKILSLLILTATLFDLAGNQTAFGQTATPSSQPKSASSEPEINKYSSILDSDFFSETDLESKVNIGFKQRKSSIPSASLRKPAKLAGLKETLKADESQVVVVENARAENLEINLFDLDGHQVKTQNQIVSTENPAVINLKPSNQFQPGRYHINITDSASDKAFSQDFTWGVLAINLNKSIYAPGEEAFISMAVLDQDGEMVCNAAVELKITAPDESQTILSTDQGTVIANPQCLSKKMSLVPDYQALYKVGSVGTYKLELKATSSNGSYSIRDSFLVADDAAFDINRSGPTRIYPPNVYPVTMDIVAKEDFEGVVQETVPASFNISQLEGAKAFNKVEVKETKSEKKEFAAALYNLGFPFKGQRNILLGFGKQSRDSLMGPKFAQYGVIGNDGVDFDLPAGSTVLAVDDGKVVRSGAGDYGTTIVIEHSWGKSYYGNLDKILVQIGDSVKKGKTLAISGKSGISGKPQLHFALKLTENNPDNGYFGKINPQQFLLHPESTSKHGQVAGMTTPSQADIKTGVQILNWQVSLKKGEKITIGYQFQAPQISPEFYLLGPLTFEQAGQIIFKETRQWQIAADSVVVSTGIVSAEAQFGGLQRKVAYVNSNWYAFYTDQNGGTMDVLYKKSADGVTWGSAVDLDANEDNDTDNYNPSIDTSGNYIHVAYLDDSTDQVQILTIDTAAADATTQTTNPCQLTSPGAFNVTTYLVSIASFSTTDALVVYSDTSTGTNVDAFEVGTLTSTTCTQSDVSPGNITFGSGITNSGNGDRGALVTLSSTKAAMVFQDGDLSYAEYDAAENEWVNNNQTIASVTDNIYSTVSDGAATPKVWVLSDAAADSTDTNFYTLGGASAVDFAEASLDADSGANDQDGTSDIDMFCISASDCKIVYTDDQDVTNTPVLRFIDCNNASCSSSNARALDTDCGDENIACNPAIHCSAGNDCHVVYFDQTSTAAPDAVFIDCDGADDTDACSTNAAQITNTDLADANSRSHFDIDCPTGTNCKFIYNNDTGNGIDFVDCADDQCTNTTDTITEVVDYGTTATPPYAAIDCPSSTTCKVVAHDADLSSGSVVLVDCSGAGTPETCATPPAPDSIQGSVGTTAERVDVAIDCLADGTNCRIVYTDDTNDDLYFVDCNDTDCDTPTTELAIDTNGGASSTVEPNVSLYCVSATDCKVLYTGALTTDAEKLYFVDCDNDGCSSGSVIPTAGPRFRGAVFCPSTGATPSQSADCKMAYYEGTASTVPAVVFADCDTTNCFPTVTDDPDPWTSESTVTSVTLTYDSSGSQLIANIVKDATNQQAYYSVSPAGSISWGTSTPYDEFTAGAMDNISSPKSAAGTSLMGVLVRLGANMEFDRFGPMGPTLDQLLRHGNWFSGGAEQAFTF